MIRTATSCVRYGRPREGDASAMDSLFFRVEHDLLRSESFKTLGGSAIKVYLVDRALCRLRDGLGLSEHPDDRQAGRAEPADGAGGDRGADAAGAARHEQVAGPVDRVQGDRAERPRSGRRRKKGEGVPELPAPTGPISLEVAPETGPKIFRGTPSNWSRIFRGAGPVPRPGRPRGWAQTRTRNERRHEQHPDSGNSLPALGRRAALVAVDLQELLTDQGIPRGWPRSSRPEGPGGRGEGPPERLLRGDGVEHQVTNAAAFSAWWWTEEIIEPRRRSAASSSHAAAAAPGSASTGVPVLAQMVHGLVMSVKMGIVEHEGNSFVLCPTAWSGAQDVSQRYISRQF